MILLFPALNHRNFDGTGTPDTETSQASSVGIEYTRWRTWMAGKYTCTRIEDNSPMDWEKDIFSVNYSVYCCTALLTIKQPCLLHLSVTLSQYHKHIYKMDPKAGIFETFTLPVLHTVITDVLGRYDKQLAKQYQSECNGAVRENFFSFRGKNSV
jgi:hypothetical protein